MNSKVEKMFPDISAARHGWQEMLLACVEHKNIHFLAKTGTNLGKLNPASVFERTNSFNEGLKGIAIGAAMGILAGVLALSFPPWYTPSHWTMILAITTVFGAVAGAIGMALLGVNMANSDLKAVKDRIAKGEILMILSVPADRVQEIQKIANELQNPR